MALLSMYFIWYTILLSWKLIIVQLEYAITLNIGQWINIKFQLDVLVFLISHNFGWSIFFFYQDVIDKTDYQVLSGEGVEEMNSVKREVMDTGIATKREFTFNTPMFGEKTFLMYIEPVFSKAGETIGVNHVAMDVTDQVLWWIIYYLTIHLNFLLFLNFENPEI